MVSILFMHAHTQNHAHWSFLIVCLSVVCSTTVVAVQWDAETQAPPRRHVLVGVLTGPVTELRVLSELHPMGRPRARHLQTDQLEGCLASVGNPQEQARHELRDDGACFEVRNCILFYLESIDVCHHEEFYIFLVTFVTLF